MREGSKSPCRELQNKDPRNLARSLAEWWAKAALPRPESMEGKAMNATTPVDGARRRTDHDEDDPNEQPLANDPAAERAAAYDRFEAHIASGIGPPNEGQGKCPTDVPIANPVLFRTEGGDADAVNAHDVQQRAIGDCFVMAPLAGLARSPEGRALIKGAITETRNDKGDVVSYTVTLHRPEEHWWRAKTFVDVQITVTRPFPCGHAQARADGNQSEIWPLVFEKAYLQYCDCNPTSGEVSDAMEVLTGRAATHVVLEGPHGYDLRRLQGDLAAGKVVVLATKTSIDDREAHDLHENHAYVVTGVQGSNGRASLVLHNPWNLDEPQLVPFTELTRWFSSVNVVSVKP